MTADLDEPIPGPGWSPNTADGETGPMPEADGPTDAAADDAVAADAVEVDDAVAADAAGADPAAMDYAAIVVAGGRSSRLGTGADKTRLQVEGVPLLDRVLTAVADAKHRVVVGKPRPVAVPVRWAREEPTGGGPAAAVVAGLELVAAPIVVLLAGDLPRLAGATVRRLLDATTAGAGADPFDGAILVDSGGRRQHLTCAVDTAALRRAARSRPTWHDAAMHELLADLRLRPVPVQGRETDDIDTAGDFSALQEGS
jgi:molybdopterin-guanine dinucleotide biosynthesis protein A